MILFDLRIIFSHTMVAGFLSSLSQSTVFYLSTFDGEVAFGVVSWLGNLSSRKVKKVFLMAVRRNLSFVSVFEFLKCIGSLTCIKCQEPQVAMFLLFFKIMFYRKLQIFCPNCLINRF